MADAHGGRQIGSLMTLAVVAALSPLFVLPLVARVAGPTEFVGLALGQAWGTLATTVIMYGWTVTGPTQVTQSARPREVLRASLVSRLIVSLVALPLLVIVAALASPVGQTQLSILSSLAFSVQGMGLVWYFVGLGRPKYVALFDTLPRLVANVAGATLAWLTNSVIVYPLFVLLVYGAAILAAAIGFSRPKRWGRLAEVALLRSQLIIGIAALKSQWRSASVASTLTFFETVPLSILGVLGSPIINGYAPFDRVLKYGYVGVYMVSSSFQGWVASTVARQMYVRRRYAILVHIILGVVGGGAFATMAPVLVNLLLGPGFDIDLPTSLWGGVALCAMSLSAGLGLNVLASAGDDRHYFQATATGAVLIVPAVVFAAQFGTVAAVAMSVALIQLLIAGILFIHARPLLLPPVPHEKD